MSDAGSAPPPPPPPNLAPPPGYSAYSPGVASAAPLRRIGGMRTAILLLLAVYAIVELIGLITLPRMIDVAERFLDGGDGVAFDEEIAPYLIIDGLTGAATVAIFVLSVIWLYRVVSNHRAVGRQTTWGPGWAVGGWFTPPLIVYAVPMLVLRESWKAADPDVPPGDDRWRQSDVNSVIYVWWALFGLAPIVFFITGVASRNFTVGQSRADFARSISDTPGLTTASGVVGIAAAVAWALLVRSLTARHATLTGEAARRPV